MTRSPNSDLGSNQVLIQLPNGKLSKEEKMNGREDRLEIIYQH